MPLNLDALREAFDALRLRAPDTEQWEFATAAKVIQIGLGRVWWDDHLYPGRSHEFVQHDHFWYRHVLHRMADDLFLLKDMNGYDVAIERFRTRPLRPTYFEVQAAGHFAQRGYSVSLMRERGIRGSDFDFRAARGDLSVNVEVTETLQLEPTGRAVAAKLKGKVSQLPKDEPAIINLVIPDAWALSPEKTTQALKEGCDALFRRSKRVNAVMVSWVARRPTGPEGELTAECFNLFHHPNPRNEVGELELVDKTQAIPDLRTLMARIEDCDGDVQQLRGLVLRRPSYLEWYEQ